MHRLRLALLLFALAAGTAAQPNPTWTRTAFLGPGVRSGHGMAYDAARNTLVVFGGSSNGDTWTWNGIQWLQHVTPGPSPRSGVALAYDRARQQTILFSGGGVLNDTWAWDGTQWTQLQPAQSPVARSNHTMVYDEARQRIVMFGGDRGNAGLPVFGDTWEWDGSAWTPRFSTNVPPGRTQHGMAYDATRRETVLFGGVTASGNANDTWTWDGTDWTRRTPTLAPTTRYDCAMAYFGVRQVVVLFGGSTSGGERDDTWYWDGTSWANVSPGTSPPARRGHALAYHEGRAAVMLFGGAQLDDTWMLRLQGVAGQFTPFGQSCAANLELTNRLGSVPRLGTTFDAELRNLPATAQGALMALGASNQFLGNFPLPIGLDFLGFTGCWLYQDTLVIAPALMGSGLATWSVPIPIAPELAGTHVYLQGVVVVPAINPAGVTVSNAGDLLIGS